MDFLLFDDVEVEQASQSFDLDGTTYPAGAYVVWMDQPRRGLANTFLEDGRNLSDVTGITFCSPPAVGNHPLLWGATRAIATDSLDARARPVSNADTPHGSLTGNKAVAYAHEASVVAGPPRRGRRRARRGPHPAVPGHGVEPAPHPWGRCPGRRPRTPGDPVHHRHVSRDPGA